MLPSIQFILVRVLSHPRMVKCREAIIFVDVVVCLEHDLDAGCEVYWDLDFEPKTSGVQPMTFVGFGIWFGGDFLIHGR